MNYVPEGVNDAALIGIKPDAALPDKLANDIQIVLDRLEKFNENADNISASRNRILRRLINLVLCHKPSNLFEYIWYARFATAILLLRDYPNSLVDSRIYLVAHVFGSYTELWAHDHKKIHMVAEAIYRTLSRISNIAHVVANISTYSQFTLYVANTLCWAGFRSIAEQEIILFRMYKPKCLVELIETATNSNDDLGIIHNFLSLYSVYQKLLFAEASDIRKHPPHFAPFFKYEEVDLSDIWNTLKQIQDRLEQLFRYRSSTDECIMMLELLRYDIMLPLGKRLPNQFALEVFGQETL